MSISLPKEFEQLERFVDKWAMPTEYERARARRSASSADIKAFYEAMVPALPDIMKRLDEYPLGKIPDDHAPLFHIALSLAEIAPHAEFYGYEPGVPHAFDEERIKGHHCGVAD